MDDLIDKLLRDLWNPRVVSRYSPIAMPSLVCIKKNAIERHDFMTHLRFVFLYNAHARYFHTTHREFYLSMGFIRSMLRSERLVANVSRDYYRSLSGNTVVRLAGIDIAAIYHYNSTALTLLFALIVFIFF